MLQRTRQPNFRLLAQNHLQNFFRVPGAYVDHHFRIGALKMLENIRQKVHRDGQSSRDLQRPSTRRLQFMNRLARQ